MYSIYVITNTINGKKYVGLTKFSLSHRWREHVRTAFQRKKKFPIHNAIVKYGRENFTIELLEMTDDTTRESYWISHFDSMNEGYNCTIGGDGTIGYVMTEENRRKFSENAKKMHTEKRIGMYGRKHSDETKALMSLVNPRRGTGKPKPVKEPRRFDGQHNVMYGKKHSDETKALISARQKAHWDRIRNQ